LSAIAEPGRATVRPAAMAGAAALVAAVFASTVALPLATYTTAVALFGLSHVLSELNYVDRRFSARLAPRLLPRIGLPILAAVLAQAAAMLGLVSAAVAVTVELLAAAALAIGVAGEMRRHRAAGAAIGMALAAGAVAAPFPLLLGLALLHNLTPLGFFAEALRGEQRRRALALLAVPLIVLPLVIASGLPTAALARLGLVLPEARLLASGPLTLNLGIFVPHSLIATDWAIPIFSAAVFAQLMHYAAVIMLLPRLPVATPARTLLPWPKRRRLLPALIAAAAGLALVFVLDYGLARQVYGLVAQIHAWVEIPILLLALGGLAAVQPSHA
jgi:hypothetical protein